MLIKMLKYEKNNKSDQLQFREKKKQQRNDDLKKPKYKKKTLIG